MIYDSEISRSNSLVSYEKVAGSECPSGFIVGPRREKACLRLFANNTGADQPAHPRSLISAFVGRF